MVTKKFASIFGGIFVFLCGTVLSVYAAWGYGGDEAPYQGNYTHWTVYGPGVTSYAYDMKWTQEAIDDMKWDGNNEWLDQTADCTEDSPGGDRLHATGSSTNIPNYGFSIYNDCRSNSNWKEETELRINPHSLSTATAYYQYVWWDCVYGGASGDLNVSMEPTWYAHQWLDKTSYQCGSYASANNTSNTTDAPTVESDSKQKVLREVDNGVYSYQVVRTSRGHLRVYSNVDFSDEQVFEAYQTENRAQLNTLLSEKAPHESLFVVVTFSVPLSIKDAQDLIQRTQMEVVSYGIFGHIGNEVVSTYKFPLSRSIEGFSQESQQIENEGELVYDGIMTITGVVHGGGVQMLDQHESVVLLDVTANQIQSEIRDLKEVVAFEQFAIPNPAWLVYTGNVNAID